MRKIFFKRVERSVRGQDMESKISLRSGPMLAKVGLAAVVLHLSGRHSSTLQQAFTELTVGSQSRQTIARSCGNSFLSTIQETQLAYKTLERGGHDPYIMSDSVIVYHGGL